MLSILLLSFAILQAGIEPNKGWGGCQDLPCMHWPYTTVVGVDLRRTVSQIAARGVLLSKCPLLPHRKRIAVWEPAEDPAGWDCEHGGVGNSDTKCLWVQPWELTPWVTVTHSRLPGCIFFAFARPSEPVIKRCSIVVLDVLWFR
ncbi:hypothetical protein DL98DRAFT_186003 [Cadophora sp. DSE1049]|nr:hypothetical protein DL98DRAFT_186003 [Cadophora sp. DSE1049]